MDLFESYLKRHRGDEQCTALIAKSYKSVYQRKYHSLLPETRTNGDLATYGDALLRFSLTSLFLGKVEELSEHIKQFLTDEFLIEHVAAHYRLIDYILFDKRNPNIPKVYTFFKNDSTKYIATTVEAIIGAIFLECRDLDAVIDMVGDFTRL